MEMAWRSFLSAILSKDLAEQTRSFSVKNRCYKGETRDLVPEICSLCGKHLMIFKPFWKRAFHKQNIHQMQVLQQLYRPGSC